MRYIMVVVVLLSGLVAFIVGINVISKVNQLNAMLFEQEALLAEQYEENQYLRNRLGAFINLKKGEMENGTKNRAT